MNTAQEQKVATGQGFIAALDQSGGSTPKALKLYGVDESMYSGDTEMYDRIHEMRTRIIKSPAFNGDKVLGAILFENTMDRQIDGQDTAAYLWERKGVVPFLKVDKGLAAEENGVQVMKPIDGLDALLERAVAKGIFGTKMRSVMPSRRPVCAPGTEGRKVTAPAYPPWQSASAPRRCRSAASKVPVSRAASAPGAGPRCRT